MTLVSPAETKIIADVAAYGWHVINVMPDGSHPPHSFSIGLERTFGHPEMVIVGLRGETAQVFINDIGRRIEAGEVFRPGAKDSELANGYPVTFIEVAGEHFSDYLGWALWFYRGEPFRAIQMVWPDRSGSFPWEPGFQPDLREIQPVLGSVASL